ncbi:hypothetical protein GCM10018791_45020 [Streptomyces zaomyceticus]|nr:hypothetical protein GCM10018791_45020 [Streptomyces zaomyceticus]
MGDGREPGGGQDGVATLPPRGRLGVDRRGRVGRHGRRGGGSRRRGRRGGPLCGKHYSRRGIAVPVAGPASGPDPGAGPVERPVADDGRVPGVGSVAVAFSVAPAVCVAVAIPVRLPVAVPVPGRGGIDFKAFKAFEAAEAVRGGVGVWVRAVGACRLGGGHCGPFPCCPSLFSRVSRASLVPRKR